MSDVVSRISLDELSSSSSDNTRTLIKPDLSIVSHVQVDLSVEVGRCSLPLSELFALKSGDTLTLLQKVDAAMVVYVGDKAVAKGNLVAVGDHFGIYITEIAD